MNNNTIYKPSIYAGRIRLLEAMSQLGKAALYCDTGLLTLQLFNNEY
jgi:hypothetical protein